MAHDYLKDDDRKEYQEDTYRWLKQRFRSMTDDFNEQAVERAKTDNFRLQNATEWLARSLIVAHDSIIVYLGAIVVIVLASVRVWTGAAGVSLIVILFYLRIRRRQKVFARLDNLRRELDELVETPESHYPTYREEMLPEDREFLQRCV